MIRHQVAAQKQILIGILFISAVLLMGALKHVFGYSGFLTLTDAARIEVYLLGVFAALLFLHERWTELLQGAFLRAPFESIMLATRLAFCQGVAFTLIYFLMRDIAVSRAFLIWFIAIGLPVNSLLIIWLPGLLRRFFNRTSAWRGVLVGRGNIPHSLLDYAERCRFFGVEFNEFYGDPQEHEVPFQHRGDIDGITDETFAADPALSRVLFFGRDMDDSDYQAALDLCQRLGVRVQVMLHEQDIFGDLARHVIDGKAHFLTIADEPLQNPLNRLVKRCVDVAISLFVVVVLLPPLIALIWLVQRWQSPGPLFFRQTRHGLDRKKFSILKFRTMNLTSASEAQQAQAADPRVYPFARVLRRMSLDEFPQFLNVLRGEMSVIGPRPHLTVHDDWFEQEIKAYRLRHFIKPGITGYAQIRGFRGEVTSPEQIHQRVQHDIYYISNWSLKLDCYILCKTVEAVLRPPESAF